MINMEWFLEPPTFNPINIIVVLMMVILCHIIVVIIQLRIIKTKIGPIIHHIGGGRVNLALLVMVKVVLVLWQLTSPPRKLIWVKTGTMRGLGHLIVISKHYFWCHIGVGIIQLIPPIVINAVLLLLKIKVELILGPPTSTTINYCCLWLGKYKSVLIVVLRRKKNWLNIKDVDVTLG